MTCPNQEGRVNRSESLNDLRDEFAMAALPGLMADPEAFVEVSATEMPAALARAAYAIADAMVEVRKARRDLEAINLADAFDPFPRAAYAHCAWHVSAMHGCLDCHRAALRMAQETCRVTPATAATASASERSGSDRNAP